jgi:hypothetical protein
LLLKTSGIRDARTCDRRGTMSPTKRSKKTARKSTTKTQRARTSTARAPRKAAKSARKTAQKARKKSGVNRPARKKSAAARKSTVAAAKKSRAPARKTARAKPAATAKKAATRRARKPAAPARKRPVSPAVARRHFQQLLEAKQARVKQGPSYPQPNAFTGQHAPAPSSSAPGGLDGGKPPAVPETPAPEATYGDPAYTHGRGNQGMRPQK